ncbi:TetR/AcrR family transcriptional regulator [Rhizobium sp. TRM95796]|uniref:TetR/AcrR family transcriptional regulator n=1 Tax=Rhizobium sp. TRM95796 TaxID=2979862 RepID=UPI0021E8C649|nr:TetR/AcrR family transcriptional regulator [Rhizobium sp. TRM95796]MCV3766696.1 TetR/AcrR family transcriptional regulator [Rhizobium sp. TRM95796]
MAKKRSESMEENRARLLAAARRAFAEKGYMAASMDDFTAEAGLTRGALYHAFGDKRGLFAAVVHQVDSEMAARARAIAADAESGWEALQKEAAAYIEMALDPEVQRIVLLDGPSVLGDPSQWPSQSSCLAETRQAVTALMADGVLKPVDPDAAARLLTGAALNAALWVAASPAPDDAMPKAIAAFRALAEGFRLKGPG